MDVYKFSKTIADTLVGQIKELKNEHSLLDLNNLRKHDAIEHDSSQDSYFGPNWVVQPAMLANLKAAAADGKSLTISELGKYRRVREADSLARNPEYYFPARHASNAHAEAATLIAVFGVAGEAVPLDSLQSFWATSDCPQTTLLATIKFRCLRCLGL